MTMDFHFLLDSGAKGVFRSHLALPAIALEAATGRGVRVVAVRLAAIRDKNAFLLAFAGAAKFPAHFGRNWDAFYDCLLDMDPGDEGILVVLQHASGFARAEPEEFAAAIDTLADATDYWKEQGKALAVIVELEAPGLAPELPEISFRAK
ncbi:MAG: barstar family protein [Betaproteobacteria bacterium]